MVHVDGLHVGAVFYGADEEAVGVNQDERVVRSLPTESGVGSLGTRQDAVPAVPAALTETLEVLYLASRPLQFLELIGEGLYVLIGKRIVAGRLDVGSRGIVHVADEQDTTGVDLFMRTGEHAR